MRVFRFISWYLSLSSLLIATSITAQDDILYREYGTHRYYGNILVGSGSGIGRDYYDNKRQIEEQIKLYQEDMKIEPVSLSIAFHCMHTDEATICEEGIASQLDALNRDFNGKAMGEGQRHPNDPDGVYSKLAASAQLSFVRAKTEVSEKYGDGVLSLGSVKKEWENWDDIKYADRGGRNAVQSSEVINVWIADLPDGMLSYATRPYLSGDADGIVIDARFFGQHKEAVHNYSQGKTLTHLIGEYLGLAPLWGEDGRCSDDGVADTPVHNAPNYKAYKTTHYSTCDGSPLEMLVNFMDGTPDDYAVLFTAGQVQRIHAILNVIRKNLFLNKKNLSE